MEFKWVWRDEVAAVLAQRMRVAGISHAEFVRMGQERYGPEFKLCERRLRAILAGGGVMAVDTADGLLTLIDAHLLDLPCYSGAMWGELPRDRWPSRRARTTARTRRSRDQVTARDRRSTPQTRRSPVQPPHAECGSAWPAGDAPQPRRRSQVDHP